MANYIKVYSWRVKWNIEKKMISTFGGAIVLWVKTHWHTMQVNQIDTTPVDRAQKLFSIFDYVEINIEPA